MNCRPLAVAAALVMASCGQGLANDASDFSSLAPSRALASPVKLQTFGQLTVDRPRPQALIASPVNVEATATAFELLALVCDANGVQLAREFIPSQGGSSTEPRPFAGSVPFSTPTTPTGSVQVEVRGDEGGPNVPCGSMSTRVQ